ncbi:MAG TPA: peptide chain release factor N(5)-glutamine methyltransferase [Pirellulales bacterium]|nr:peptide chain release factor N(5)-glutamine methyltransferase [Pirellulales bacterium]
MADAASAPWTIGRLLAWTADYLKGRGADSPRLDAEVLLAHVLRCQRIELYTRFEEQPNDSQRAAYRELVKQRAEGMPVAYLVGRREFFSLPFRVTTDVLIPRPETEFLVIRLLDLIRQQPPRDEPWRIADVGTGSGIIAICAAKQLPNCGVMATDISAAALEVARSNAAEHGVSARIAFLQGDLLASVAKDAKFDFIASNPPYVKSSEMAGLAADVRRFEPREALEAGPQGTEVIERLIPQAAERLQPGGSLLLEISPMIDEAVRELLTADGRWQLMPTVKDLAGLPRVAEARKR